MSTKFWRLFWLSAALFNLINGLLLLLDYKLYYSLIGAVAQAPRDPMWVHIVAWLVILFSGGYYLVAENLTTHNDIVLIGGLAKVGVWAAVTSPWILGEPGDNNAWSLMVLVQCDLLYSMFFFIFLRQQKHLKSQH